MFPASLLRSSTRQRNPGDYRNAIMGFRMGGLLLLAYSGPANATRGWLNVMSLLSEDDRHGINK
jgi:hypothetical protein